MKNFRVPVISSPDVEIFSRGKSDFIPDEKTLMALGGRAPDPAWTRELIERNAPRVVAADSGVRVCRACGAPPSVLIGDMDSASPDDWKWAVKLGAEEKIYDRDKDKTDFQLALEIFEDGLSEGAPPSALIVTGCFGGAMDHLMSAFFTLGSSGGNFFRCMMDEAEGAFFVSPGEEASLEFSRAPEAVSLLPVTDECRGVRISGVKWPLCGVTLERKFPWAISNEVIPDETGAQVVAVSCAEGVLAAYWRY